MPRRPITRIAIDDQYMSRSFAAAKDSRERWGVIGQSHASEAKLTFDFQYCLL